MQTRHVLIVEDTPTDRELVALALRRDPTTRYKIVEAPSGQEGLALLAKEDPSFDVVFLDFNLPDMDADQFVSSLLTGHEVVPVPIVVLTGSLQADPGGYASLKRGVQDFFTKDEVTSSIVCRIARNAIERHQLLKQVVESERRASEAVEAAERADRAKSQFLALVSHELRTPLTAILGFCRLLEKDPSRQDAEKMLRMVIDSGEHLEQLLNDLIDVAKVEAGTLEIVPADFDPHSLLRNAVALLEGRAREKGLTLHCEIDVSTPAVVRTDPIRLRQILVNLLGNAIKFTASGSVRCRLKWDHAEEMLIFDVSDTGPGIPASLLPNLFTPFTQGKNNAMQQREGAGLGLAISRKLAAMMSGDIRVVHSDSSGTEFAVRVVAPRVLSKIKSTVKDEEVEGELDLSGKNIAIADDTRANRYLLEQLLILKGARVSTFSNGAELLECFEDEHNANVDLVLMDMLMPVMDGEQTTREIRRRGYETPIIAVTAAVADSERSKCLDAGCSAVVTKPIDVAQLDTAIKQLLG